MVANMGGGPVFITSPRFESVLGYDARPQNAGWSAPPSRLFRCEIRLCPEPEGGYSVYSPELPGVVSEGDNTEEAIRNISEALQGALATYLEDAGVVPWKRDAEPVTSEETRRWIVVDV